MEASFDMLYKEVEDRLYSVYRFAKVEKSNYDSAMDALYIRCRYYLYGEEKAVHYVAHGFMVKDFGYSDIADDIVKVFCNSIHSELIKGRRKK